MAKSCKDKKNNKFTYRSVTGEDITICSGADGITAKWIRILEEEERAEQIQEEIHLKHSSFYFINLNRRAASDPDFKKVNPLEEIPDPSSDIMGILFPDSGSSDKAYEILQECIDQLTPAQQDLICELFDEQKTMAEIAREQGVTHAAISNRRQKVLARLKKMIDSKGL